MRQNVLLNRIRRSLSSLRLCANCFLYTLRHQAGVLRFKQSEDSFGKACFCQLCEGGGLKRREKDVLKLNWLNVDMLRGFGQTSTKIISIGFKTNQ